MKILIFLFHRIAHAPRGPYFKVKGDLILISSDLQHTMDRVLPIDQNLIPVSFKRRLAYSGSFIEEYVEKKKLLMFFEFLKENNHLYKVMLSMNYFQQPYFFFILGLESRYAGY